MKHSLLSPRLLGLLAVWLLSTGVPAMAASFDCQKASTTVERAICASPELSELDSTLAAHYKRAMAQLAPEQRDALRTEQRGWLQTRNACATEVNTPAACLQPLMRQRVVAVGKLTQPDTADLDAIIASVAYHPAEAADALKRYPMNDLAAAWLVYLHRFEPSSGVTQAQADENRQQVIKSLADDNFPSSLFSDLENDPKVSRDRVELTLLRMMIERAGYESRDYVHCFVFSRQGEAAYEAFGPLYGSTRDSFAPICAPQGDLFAQPAWKQLRSSVDDAVSTASGDAGTIRFASYADWQVLALRATVSPRDFLKAPTSPAVDDSESTLRHWTDEKSWPKKQRQQALAAVEPARLATSSWLQQERGFSLSEAQQAAKEIVRQWLSQRVDFIGENSGGE